jgi:hypothetical protein
MYHNRRQPIPVLLEVLYFGDYLPAQVYLALGLTAKLQPCFKYITLEISFRRERRG